MKGGTVLARQVFETPRVLDFFDETHLTNQIGHPRELWRLALSKALIDNALDAAEEAGPQEGGVPGQAGHPACQSTDREVQRLRGQGDDPHTS